MYQHLEISYIHFSFPQLKLRYKRHTYYFSLRGYPSSPSLVLQWEECSQRTLLCDGVHVLRITTSQYLTIVQKNENPGLPNIMYIPSKNMAVILDDYLHHGIDFGGISASE